MADEDQRRYLFVAIDRATRWVFLRIYSAKTAAYAPFASTPWISVFAVRGTPKAWPS